MTHRFFRLFLPFLALLLVFGATGCSKTDPNNAPAITPSASEEKAPCTTHAYYVAERINARALADGSVSYVCDACGATDLQILPATNSIKILAVGNSFSTDAMEYLWDICKDAGISEVILGNLYIGGCSLDTHASNFQYNLGAYTYYKNTNGAWTEKKNVKPYNALTEEDWDYITIQQTSKTCGLPDSYSRMNTVLNILDLNKTNPNAQLIFHMTWAYQQDSTHSSFPKYNNDQMTMYQMTVDTVEAVVLSNRLINGVIPAGTAIQNIRTSYVGDTVTRDGYHMSYDYGRYTVALTWYAYLTGGSLDAVDWVPPKKPHLENHLAVIRESVENALRHPYTVTNSQYTTLPK
ncbi:MAG: DUF4886 domain-containing protein [Ruminococcaceae bacterium]|nr:DUF4886 domain-containing protein [Oscillospiraceae bacterium]